MSQSFETLKKNSEYKKYFTIRYSQEGKRDLVWKFIVRYLERILGKPSSSLEIAAGYCSLINASSAEERWALDINEEITKYAHSDVRTLVGDANKILVKFKGRVDHIYISNFLEHVSQEYASKLLISCRRIMKSDGRLILIQPNYRFCSEEYFDDYTHKTVYSHVSLVDFLEANDFRVVKCRERFLPMTFKSRKSLFFWLTPIYLRFPIKPMAKQMLVIAR